MATGLVVSNGGLLDLLLMLRNGIFLRYYVRLFQNDHQPDRAETVGSYTEAVFSGYPGPQQIMHWSPPALSVNRGIVTAAPIPYAQSGGPLGCYVFGYYVTDGAGNLIWAERVPGLPVPMFHSGDVFSVVPTLTDYSDLP